MRAAFQMDHLSRLNPVSDSTFMLIEENATRGGENYFFEPHQLSWQAGVLSARMQRIHWRDGQVSLDDPQLRPLSEMDVVWMRQDPPFNMRYITATHLLEHAGTKVVNDPAGVRNAPEKLAALPLHDFMPPTLVSLDSEVVHRFADMHKTIVAKPLHGYGGRSVFRFESGDRNIDTLIEQWGEMSGEPLMWQAFLPEVATSDVRIILVNGEVASIFQREPQGGSIRANMRVGGIAKKMELGARHREVCGALGPMLKANGLLFVGLDMIGDYLTEINVTSPTGLRAAQKLYGQNIAAQLWDAI